VAGAEQDRVQLVAGPCRGGRLLARLGRALDRGAEALRRGRARRVLRPVRTRAPGRRDSFPGGSLSGVRQDRARGDRRLTEQFGYDLAWVALQYVLGDDENRGRAARHPQMALRRVGVFASFACARRRPRVIRQLRGANWRE
jgi:hypothetical protein